MAHSDDLKHSVLPIDAVNYDGVSNGVVDHDECPRSDTSREVIAKLKPIHEDGVTSAGMSCPIAEGASA